MTESIKATIESYEGFIETISSASAKMDDLIDRRLKEYDNIVDYLDTRLDQSKLLFGDNYNIQNQIISQKIDANFKKMASIGEAIKQKQVTVDTLQKIEATNIRRYNCKNP